MACGGSIEGAQEIATPVVFAVLTTVAAFTPLLFIPGMMGKMFVFVPLVVIPCLLFSLVESLNILPAHLAHIGRRRRPGVWRRFQRLFADGLRTFVTRGYQPFLAFALRWRYLSLAVGVSTLIVTVGMVLAGWVAFHFFPSPEQEVIAASVTMPLGTPAAVTSAAVGKLEVGADRLRREVRAQTGADVFRHIYTAVGDQPMAARGPGAMRSLNSPSASHVGEVMIEIAPAEERELRAEELGNRWRELTGPIPEATEVNFQTSGMSFGDDVDVMLVGPDVDRLRAAANRVKQHLRAYAGVL